MNKKLIKSIVSITCGLGVSASIPFTATSCGSSSEESWPENAIPKKFFQIDSNGVLIGFNDSIPDEYSLCDTLLIPKEVKTINVSSFLRQTFNTNIKNLKFEKGSYLYDFKINKNLFRGFTLIDLSNCLSLENISESEFSYLSNVEKIILPKSVINIEQEAFYECSSLVSVNFKECENLISIGTGAFKNCSQLTNLYISKKIASIGERAFSNCSTLNINNVLISENNNFYGIATNTGQDSLVVVKKIDNQCLYNSENQTVGSLMFGKIQLNDPDDFSGQPFYGTNVDEIITPSGLSTIPDGAFAYSNIGKITFTDPTSLVTISSSAFRDSEINEEIDLSECTELKEIGYRAFSYAKISKIILPKNLKTIGNQCFLSCSIEDFEIDSDNSSFAICTSFSSAKLLIERTETNEWTDTTKLVGGLGIGDVDLSQTNISSLTDNAFSSSCGIKSFIFPSSLTKIGANAFASASNIDQLDFSNTAIDQISRYFLDRSTIKKIFFKTVGTISYNAFSYSSCTEIHWINLSSNPTTTFQPSCFDNLYIKDARGHVFADNPIGEYNSTKLLEFLQTKGLPTKWTVGE